MVLAEHQLFEMRTSDVLISKMKNVEKKKTQNFVIESTEYGV